MSQKKNAPVSEKETKPQSPKPTTAETTPSSPTSAEHTTEKSTATDAPATNVASAPVKPAESAPAAPAKPAATAPATSAAPTKPAATAPATSAAPTKPAATAPATPATPAKPAATAPATPATPATSAAVPAQPTTAAIAIPESHSESPMVIRKIGTTNPSDLVWHVSIISDDDLHYFNEGTHFYIYKCLGSRPLTIDGTDGAYFAVWAPDADGIFVMGDFNGWNRESHRLFSRGFSGIWEGFIPGVKKGHIYKYYVSSRFNGYRVEKADPYGVHHENPPRTGSIVWDIDYTWNDQEWMQKRAQHNDLNAPISIYEMHFASWKRVPEDDHRSLSYREMAEHLPKYLNEMGFTHVEFMPIMEHPFGGSWGYQVTGYFAPSSRFGTPQDFMYLIDTLHQHNIGVILDWVPSHFATDSHGLGFFDGTHLYEHSYPQKGFHPDWKSFIPNYGRNEVRSFLISSAIYWFEMYHIDGIRVDAVASMLYLDYSRKDGEWMPNQYGGKENIEAIWFLRRLNEEIYRDYPDTQTIAEESTSWGMVSRPTYVGGLGFGMKWDMGWMHDTLQYMSKDPVYRKYHHNNLTFRMLYAWHENFVLPLSHDEVVHGKGSLLSKMPGDLWQKFANLRALFGYMYAQPAKKMLFMGGEFGQWREWQHEESLDWHLTEHTPHVGLQRWIADLNKLYRSEPALHEYDCQPQGFEWIDCNDSETSVISLIRYGESTNNVILVVCNFTPVYREQYQLGAPYGGFWQEVLNGDSEYYGGSGKGNAGGIEATSEAWHGRPYSLKIVLPPLAVVFFKGTHPAEEALLTDAEEQDASESAEAEDEPPKTSSAPTSSTSAAA